jgi:hypothetical protein
VDSKRVAVSVAVVVRRSDGKLYPAGGSLPWPERRIAIGQAHRLRCVEGLSYRQVVAALEDVGIRRSIRRVWLDIRDYSCRSCSPQDFEGEPPTG